MIPEPGTYEIAVGLKTGNDRGRFQFSIDGDDFGAVQEGYSVIPACEQRVVATTVTFYTPAKKAFTFSIIGRDRQSFGYALALDYVDLTPRIGFASELSQQALTQLSQPDVNAAADGLWEQYGVASTGVTLRWKVFHAYHYPGPTPGCDCSSRWWVQSGECGTLFRKQGFGDSGFLALSTDYRLAPPHTPMNEANHGPVGQDSSSQSMMVTTRRKISTSKWPYEQRVPMLAATGLFMEWVVRAGASHVLYAMATGAPGDDQFDLGVSLSPPAKYEDVAWLQEPCVLDETCPQSAIENYLGIATGSALRNLLRFRPRHPQPTSPHRYRRSSFSIPITTPALWKHINGPP